ncbi:MAG: hypothetical protein MK135_04760, partial [Polyangiaceae bacterium]|nr:hypothetical protein [Polyangiaceae bacterium]
GDTAPGDTAPGDTAPRKPADDSDGDDFFSQSALFGEAAQQGEAPKLWKDQNVTASEAGRDFDHALEEFDAAQSSIGRKDDRSTSTHFGIENLQERHFPDSNSTAAAELFSSDELPDDSSPAPYAQRIKSTDTAGVYGELFSDAPSEKPISAPWGESADELTPPNSQRTVTRRQRLLHFFGAAGLGALLAGASLLLGMEIFESGSESSPQVAVQTASPGRFAPDQQTAEAAAPKAAVSPARPTSPQSSPAASTTETAKASPLLKDSGSASLLSPRISEVEESQERPNDRRHSQHLNTRQSVEQTASARKKTASSTVAATTIRAQANRSKTLPTQVGSQPIASGTKTAPQEISTQSPSPNPPETAGAPVGKENETDRVRPNTPTTVEKKRQVVVPTDIIDPWRSKHPSN